MQSALGTWYTGQTPIHFLEEEDVRAIELQFIGEFRVNRYGMAVGENDAPTHRCERWIGWDSPLESFPRMKLILRVDAISILRQITPTMTNGSCKDHVASLG